MFGDFGAKPASPAPPTLNSTPVPSPGSAKVAGTVPQPWSSPQMHPGAGHGPGGLPPHQLVYHWAHPPPYAHMAPPPNYFVPHPHAHPPQGYSVPGMPPMYPMPPPPYPYPVMSPMSPPHP
eukprot:Mycagemm_TRINITY_DN10180_c0_g2::TRINITY_DN10180_c0_g2_i1::g.5082::m.5082 type:complete len:121 gc:universal TRINITY_DN10180_c0_g2_i1:640-1002(+)